MSQEDREEAHVRALADIIREAFAEQRPDDAVNQLVEAAMGDEVAAEREGGPGDLVNAGHG